MNAQGAPIFSLYGEAPQAADPLFVHVERVRDRDAIHNGRVRPHRHPHLHQLTLWSNGNGHFTIEDSQHPLPRSALTIMPAGIVHGFEIAPETNAIVVSLSDDFFRKHLDGGVNGLAGTLRAPRLLELRPPAPAPLTSFFTALEREYQHKESGQTEAIEAYVRLILVTATRLSDAVRTVTPHSERDLLVSRYLEIIERHFRERWTTDRYALELGATPYLLNVATRASLGQSASEAIYARVILEAKRLLLYTALSISEISLALGYDDPSHFSRMFRAETNSPPGAWRRARLAMTSTQARSHVAATFSTQQ